MASCGPEFFTRATTEVARDLLGALLRVRGPDGAWTAGRIVETEAYGGEDDPASHAGRGPTPRSAIMFGPPGVAYVYLIYGMHHCLNVVTGPEGEAGAVLVRALESVTGRELMAARRGVAPGRADLLAGPGKLCRALDIDLAWNGLIFHGPAAESRRDHRLLLLEPADEPWPAVAGPRIGISRARRRPWRFAVPGHPGLSR